MVRVVQEVTGDVINSLESHLLLLLSWLLDFNSEEQLLCLCGKQFTRVMGFYRDLKGMSPRDGLRLMIGKPYGLTPASFFSSFRVNTTHYMYRPV